MDEGVDGDGGQTNRDLTTVNLALLARGMVDPAVTQCSDDALYMYRLARHSTVKLSPATTVSGDAGNWSKPSFTSVHRIITARINVAELQQVIVQS